MRKSGATPHSIRMRGFYRAVKRNEPWALRIWKHKDTSPLQYALSLIYRNVDFYDLVYLENPLLKLLQSSDSGGKYYPVPLIYGK